MAKKYIDKSKARKRSNEQVLRDRKRIADLILQGHTHQEIADTLYKETGIQISRRMVTTEVGKIRKDWLENRRDSYDMFINQEMSRLDTLERELWRAWRVSCQGAEKKIVEEIAKQLSDNDESDEDYELVVSKVTTILDDRGGVGDIKLFDKIISVQKERRRLLGLYAPARLGIDLRQKTELVVKGYAIRDVSPDVWPSLETGEEHIIEGEYNSE